MNENVETLIFCGVAFAIGMGVGQFLSFRRKDKNHVALEVESKELWAQIGRQTGWILVVVLFMASVLQSVLFTYSQRQCNIDVVETIKYRANISQEDAQLNDDRSTALRHLVDDIVQAQALPDELRGPAIRKAFDDYQVEIDKIETEKQNNQQKRAERPYPECL